VHRFIFDNRYTNQNCRYTQDGLPYCLWNYSLATCLNIISIIRFLRLNVTIPANFNMILSRLLKGAVEYRISTNKINDVVLETSIPAWLSLGHKNTRPR
jgi:hypothetical protein